MSDDYLWDKSGEPDPEVGRLEKLLAPLAHKPRPLPELPATAPRRPKPLYRWLTAAASVVLVVGAVWLYRSYGRPSWEVARLEGAPRIGGVPITGSGRLRLGGTLETDASSSARIRASQIGEVDVGPNTRLRLLASKGDEHRLALDRGTIKVMIWAAPRLFYVNTPSAVTVDLGCAYTLEVDDSGAGVVYVTAGWVAFQLGGRESFIPAGAACRTRPRLGPGTPYYVDASDAFRAALDRVDASTTAGPALDEVLREARRRDAFTLWHLLKRASGGERAKIYDCLAALAPPPATVTREGVLDGDARMFDQWWDTLGLGDTSWFRLWKGPWPPQGK